MYKWNAISSYSNYYYFWAKFKIILFPDLSTRFNSHATCINLFWSIKLVVVGNILLHFKVKFWLVWLVSLNCHMFQCVNLQKEMIMMHIYVYLHYTSTSLAELTDQVSYSWLVKFVLTISKISVSSTHPWLFLAIHQCSLESSKILYSSPWKQQYWN